MLKKNNTEFSLVCLYYGIISFATAILQNIFILYHVDIYLNVFKVDRLSFWVAELIFLVWNSLNDYLFAWFSDKDILSNSSTGNIVDMRLQKLIICGPLLSASFLLVWMPWGVLSVAMQFLLVLCIYDSFLTVVDLHLSALQADISFLTHDRAQLNLGATVGSAGASLSVFVSYLVWNRTALLSFQVFIFFISAISFILYIYACKMLLYYYHRWKLSQSDHENKPTKSFSQHKKPQPTLTLMYNFSNQLKSHTNFLYFCLMQLIQVFHCHFNSNFFPLFLLLIVSDANSFYGSLLLSLSFIFPHLNNIYFLMLCDKFGVYFIVKSLFVVKIISGLLIVVFLPSNFVILSLFILSNRMFTEGICKLLNLIISDLVDEDYVRNMRSEPVSALIFGSASLLSKPGQTLAPLIGTFLLSRLSGIDSFSDYFGHISGDMTLPVVREACLRMLGWVPLVCGCVQLLIWTQFSLHGHRLNNLKVMCHRRQQGIALHNNV